MRKENGDEVSKEEKSIIIGHWRMGVKTEHIAAIMGISYQYVEAIINDYEKLKNEKR